MAKATLEWKARGGFLKLQCTNGDCGSFRFEVRAYNTAGVELQCVDCGEDYTISQVLSETKPEG